MIHIYAQHHVIPTMHILHNMHVKASLYTSLPVLCVSVYWVSFTSLRFFGGAIRGVCRRFLFTVSLLLFRNITQTYKHTPPLPPHPTPSPLPPKRGEGQAPPSLCGKRGRGRGGGICLYFCVMFRNVNREVVSNFL